VEKLLTSEQLIEFENDIAECFNNKQIKAPIHLYNGNEKQIIEVFKDVQSEDWVFCSWRSHYQCLLKGVPQDQLKKAILDGRSISLCFKDYRIFSSAIVGGNIPIALGVALDIKRKKEKNKVWCFVGDMTSQTGGFHEAVEYAFNHELPITFVIEDNGKSVCTDTKKTWGRWRLHYEPEEQAEGLCEEDYISKCGHVWYYKYKLDKYPHSGPGGKRIQF